VQPRRAVCGVLLGFQPRKRVLNEEVPILACSSDRASAERHLARKRTTAAAEPLMQEDGCELFEGLRARSLPVPRLPTTCDSELSSLTRLTRRSSTARQCAVPTPRHRARAYFSNAVSLSLTSALPRFLASLCTSMGSARGSAA